MSARIKRRMVYSATIIAILALVTGFALASFAIGPFTSVPGQSGAQSTTGATPGVAYTSEFVLSASTTSHPPAGACAMASTVAGTGTPLVELSTVSYCTTAQTIIAGDFVQQATLTFSCTTYTTVCTVGAIAPEYSIQVFFGGGATPNPVEFYMTPPAWAAADSATLVLAFDLTVGGVATVTSVNIIVSTCSAVGTCPA
jgi:hypothetical protein